ncbi:hypothetical protein EST38_g7713 [Candolleomyces aberdarensis]|uniref:Uncharacterized protein n=1 Tax=Candolleomyces aberdarensis TaxID=2316362 RepID=A0A4Q2DEE6_9AGAR|nr:hypothetical protein EST38_g7713 [Candolleomyces aberdarensis]
MVYHKALGRFRESAIRKSFCSIQSQSQLDAGASTDGGIEQIGSVPTPWPSWLIAAHPERASAEAVTDILQRLTTFVREFDSEEKRKQDNVDFIKDKFGYPEEDIRAWLETVKYPQNCLEIPNEVLLNTLSVLEKAGALIAPQGGFDVNQFIGKDVVKLTY